MNNAQKCTTPPWMVEPINDGDTYQITTTDRKPYRFAILAETTGGTQEDKANAALMAASPELLEALKGLVRIVEGIRYSNLLGKNQTERFDKAKEIIAKAEGI